MAVNVLMIEVIYSHTASVAGWSKYEMLLLVGTSMLIQRLLMGFFWSNLFEMGRNVRSGYFDFFLAQPGNPLFMVSTRKLDPDGLLNSVVAGAVSATPPTASACIPAWSTCCSIGARRLRARSSTTACSCSPPRSTFWITSTQGIEGSYFTLIEFSRLPREAFRGVANVVFVWALPAVVVSNVPARSLIHGFQPACACWLFAASLGWFALAVFVFNRGLRRYASASS